MTAQLHRLPAATTAAGSSPARRWRRTRDWAVAYAFVAPLVVLFLVFSLYPFLRTLQLSFTDWDGLSASFGYVGLDNYVQSLRDRVWWSSLWHGLLFAVVALTLMQGLSLLLALGVNRRRRSAAFYRTAFYLPPVLSGIVVALVWRWIYQPYGGPLAELFTALGIESLARPWLAESGTALWAVSIASVWQGVGNAFLLFLAALQSIPEELNEAAAVDGANPWQRFRAVTLPWLTPTIGMVSVLTLLGAMQIFNLVLAMTGGGPGYATEVPVLHIYRAAFEFSQFGYATALSVVLGIILLAVSALAMRVSRRDRTR
ncbi:carbohydrate ABC transporter permease [Micromonospora sp. NPDC047740]|uniref:carbohydrate ABC transporter permease n=1 Tax=Micromonospora sp. NPDC047740 TaxID=3364254 RepID=UPI00371F2580